MRQPSFNKNDIMDKVFKSHNYDGIKAHDDVMALLREERNRAYAKRFMYISAGLTLGSLYNLKRFTSLSPSG